MLAQNSYNAIYEKCHNVTVVHETSVLSQKEVIIKLSKNVCDPNLEIKIIEMDNYSFNYTANINFSVFNQMKSEQCLEINFEELQSQIVDLLHETLKEQMFLRIEANSNKCRMIFYEKSRLKSLIFLIIDFNITNQTEIIREITKNMSTLKEYNKNLTIQLNSLKSQNNEKDLLLNRALMCNKSNEKQIIRDMHLLESVFSSNLSKIQFNISEKLNHLNRRHVKIMNDLKIVKSENHLKCESNVRLVNSMHAMRIENESNLRVIDDLKMEINHLNILKCNAEKNNNDLRQDLNEKDRNLNDLKEKIVDLSKDMKEAAILIAHKTNKHDELAKDLVQANSMIVNFNNHYDVLNKDLLSAREIIADREAIIKDQSMKLMKINEEFEKYKHKFDLSEMNQLKQELALSTQRLMDIEKQQKDTQKLNDLLTRKISSSVDITQTPRTMNFLPPSQRHNYK